MPAATPRLYLEPPIAAGPRTLDAERSHYLARVLRLKPGAQVCCFDGAGTEHPATVVSAGPRAVVLELEDPRAHTPPPVVRLHLAQGWLKGQAMDLVVQKATELGVTDVWPLVTARSTVRLTNRRTESRISHWRKVVVSAAEQCGRSHLPIVHPPTALDAFLGATHGAALVLLEPGAPPLPPALPEGSLALLVGPEGGWEPGEVAAAGGRGAQRFGLGPLVLRAETAPLAALAAIRHGWGWRGPAV